MLDRATTPVSLQTTQTLSADVSWPRFFDMRPLLCSDVNSPVQPAIRANKKRSFAAQYCTEYFHSPGSRFDRECTQSACNNSSTSFNTGCNMMVLITIPSGATRGVMMRLEQLYQYIQRLRAAEYDIFVIVSFTKARLAWTNLMVSSNETPIAATNSFSQLSLQPPS